ncbi:hypothetical protein PAXRUDRAFT_694028 [Paxillus rubicundulus Ve08.2h10]|uniref:Uncharacterized protein n=1 Tax=Paxillus rubicundulus Ve08.2h10 TaxID=930991 RepID=A0A0D0CSM5_9AGAM|nr:hypothetical protein PAXRUDRAFT_694028 [Paxillus rubicundulus Ve08.2h10]
MPRQNYGMRKKKDRITTYNYRQLGPSSPVRGWRHRGCSRTIGAKNKKGCSKMKGEKRQITRTCSTLSVIPYLHESCPARTRKKKEKKKDQRRTLQVTYVRISTVSTSKHIISCTAHVVPTKRKKERKESSNTHPPNNPKSSPPKLHDMIPPWGATVHSPQL